MTDLATARRILDTLVAFDTTSHRSNLALVEWVEAYLARHGVQSRRVPNDEGTKTNLFATCGPAVAGGVILSGHTDVVPVEGQDWSTDPWVVAERNGTLVGRGVTDMKGFIALALAWVPRFVNGAKPVHLALSYDEEVGCQGAPRMIARMAETIAPPRLAIVGEPSSLRVVAGHKGIAVHEVTVRGHEAHSSLVEQGVSANMVAIELMHELAELAKTLRDRADPANGFDPAQATLTVGVMQGGEAANILAGHAMFVFDLRCPPNEDPDAILAPFMELCREHDRALKRRFPHAGVEVVRHAATPPMTPEGSSEAIAFVRNLTGENADPVQVAYAAEGGQFQRAGFPTVICGPGSIEQAHQPDEWIALDQLAAGARFMDRLATELGG